MQAKQILQLTILHAATTFTCFFFFRFIFYFCFFRFVLFKLLIIQYNFYSLSLAASLSFKVVNQCFFDCELFCNYWFILAYLRLISCTFDSCSVVSWRFVFIHSVNFVARVSGEAIFFCWALAGIFKTWKAIRRSAEISVLFIDEIFICYEPLRIYFQWMLKF